VSLKILQRWLLTSESINIKGYKAKKVPVTPFNDPLLPDQSIPGITQTTEYPLIYVVFQNINFVVVILNGLFKTGYTVVLCNSRFPDQILFSYLSNRSSRFSI